MAVRCDHNRSKQIYIETDAMLGLEAGCLQILLHSI